MSHCWAVITKATKEGNMALPNIDVIEQVTREFGIPVMAALQLRTQVFHLGEVLLLDDEYGREISGLRRKPSKWDVDYVTFPLNQAEKVIEKVMEVLQ